MSIFARSASAAVLVVAVGLLAVTVILRQPVGSSVSGPAASPSPAPESEIRFTSTFVSPTNGLTFDYLDRGGLSPATSLWDPLTQPLPDDTGAHDGPFDVVETGLAAVFKAASTRFPDGAPIDAWVDEHLTPGFCGIPRSQQAEITIDGHQGKVQECAHQIDATVIAGGRLYLVSLLHDRRDARAVFDVWVATIHLTPETAAMPSSTPS